MSIQSGIGVGEAQVYNTNGSLNTYARLAAKQQAERANEQKALADQLAKVKVDGVRDVDKPIFFQKYEGLKNLQSELSKARSTRDKMEIQSRMDREFLELNDFGSNSREYGKLHSDISGKLLDDRFRDQFSDDGVTKWTKSANLPLGHPELVQDPALLGRQVNINEVNKRIDGLDKNLLGKSRWGNPIETPHTQGNKKGVYTQNRREVSAIEQYSAYLNEFDTNRNFKKFLIDSYGDQPKEVLVKAYADERRATGTLSEETPKQFKENDDWKEKALFSDALARKRDAAKEKLKGTPETIQTVRQDRIERMFSGDDKANDELQAEVEGSKDYSGKLTIDKKGDNTTYNIPPKMKDGEAVKGTAYSITINKNNPSERYKLNQLISDVTGENIPYGGYKGIKGNKNKNPQEQPKSGKHPNFKGDVIKQGGNTYTWNKKTNSYE